MRESRAEKICAEKRWEMKMNGMKMAEKRSRIGR